MNSFDKLESALKKLRNIRRYLLNCKSPIFQPASITRADCPAIDSAIATIKQLEQLLNIEIDNLRESWL